MPVCDTDHPNCADHKIGSTDPNFNPDPATVNPPKESMRDLLAMIQHDRTALGVIIERLEQLESAVNTRGGLYVREALREREDGVHAELRDRIEALQVKVEALQEKIAELQNVFAPTFFRP